jgi:4-hydroxyphenylpyruvate dioxygenase-like putative hemolysin
MDKMENWYRACFGLREIQHFEIADLHVKTVMLEAESGFKVELIELKDSKREHNFADPLNASSVQGYGHIALQVQDV